MQSAGGGGRTANSRNLQLEAEGGCNRPGRLTVGATTMRMEAVRASEKGGKTPSEDKCDGGEWFQGRASRGQSLLCLVWDSSVLKASSLDLF